jgi:hypothetical protein
MVMLGIISLEIQFYFPGGWRLRDVDDGIIRTGSR